MVSCQSIIETASKKLGIDIKEISASSSTGTSKNYKVIYQGKSHLLKTYGPEVELTTSPITILLKRIFEKGLVPDHRATREEHTSNKIATIEAKVLQSWELQGIDAPRIISTDYNSMLLMEFIEGDNYRNLLSQGRCSSKHHDALLENLNQLQGAIGRTKDPLTFHNDFHIGNFMYDIENQISKAIDPGLVLNPRLSFEETNAYLNLFFCYSLLSEEHLPPTSKPQSTRILQDFVSILNPTIKQKMLKLNKHTPRAYMIYQWTKKQITGRESEYEWFKAFNKTNFSIVNHFLQQ